MTFLPSFLLAIISTLDVTSKKSLSILISHPYLVLLPTFTCFSYSKLQICGDRRVTFSAKLSIINIIINAVVPCGAAIIFIAIFEGFQFIIEGLEVFLAFLVPALLTMGEYSTKKSKSCPDCNLKIKKLP